MRKVVPVLMPVLLVVSSLLGLGALAPAASAATTGLTAAQTGRIVSTEPSRATPNVLDGTVYSVTQVGSQIVVGGKFTQVQDYNTTPVLTRTNVFAFDATTGKVNTAFAPEPNGTVYKVQAAADGTSVYVGGKFTTAGGRTIKNLFRADVATGVLTSTFTPSNIDGEVRDLEVVGDRLWAAGKFTHIGGVAQKGLATLKAATGKYDSYFTGVLSGLHNPAKTGSVTDVLQISTNPANTELAAVGNFTAVNGQSRSQVMKLDLSGATYALSPWNTTLYTQACSSSFDTYMTDVEYSPNGSYFVVSTTGAYGGNGSLNGTSGCDVVARFESDNSPQAMPSWTSYTGGDTTWTVEVTDNVIYTGGHMRWQNNPTAGDRPGQGAVARTGIAALNPVTGLAYSWNPTRARGVGVQDLLATADGLYVGSDTTLIGTTAGNTYHARIAMLPLSSGTKLPTISPYTLPGDVYTVASNQSQLVRRSFDGSTVASSSNAPAGPGFGNVVGAFMVNGTLYTATSNGVLSKQTFDGTSYGASSVVGTADALTPQTDWHQGDVPYLTSLFYSNGRIYFTKAGQNTLFVRGFETESDIVGQQRFGTVAPAGITYSTVRGAVVAGGRLYFANTNGQLLRADWNGSAPVAGTVVQVSGPGKDAQGWSSRAMFVYQGVPNTPPTAAAKVSCNGLTCSFDGSASADPDGTITGVDWDFGDGSAHGTEATTTHTYGDAGDHTVVLTVTDNRGGTATATRVASTTASVSAIGFVGGASTASGATTPVRVTVPSSVQPGDTLLLVFSAASTSATYTPPAGWTEVQNQNSNDVAGRVWRRTAVAGDAGTSVAVSSSVTVKSNVSVLAYRGVDVADPVPAAATKPDNTATATHTTPTVTSPDGSTWLVSVWTDKSSSTTGWTAPAGDSQRAGAVGTGSGYISSLVTDSSGPVGSGAQGGLSATTPTATKGLTMSLLLKSS